MPLIVHVEPVVDGMILQVGNVPGNVNGSIHNGGSLMARGRAGGPPVPGGGGR